MLLAEYGVRVPNKLWWKIRRDNPKYYGEDAPPYPLRFAGRDIGGYRYLEHKEQWQITKRGHSITRTIPDCTYPEWCEQIEAIVAEWYRNEIS